MGGSEGHRDDRAETPPPALEYESNPPRPSDGPAPVLSYQDRADGKAERRGSRARAIRNGVLSVWGIVGFTGASFFATRDVRALLLLGGGAVALLLIGIRRWVADRHGGFLLGAFLGTLSVMGTGFLLFVVLCR